MAAAAITAAAGRASGGHGLGPQIPPVRRAPLGPFKQPIDYAITLPAPLPVGRDLLTHRANFCAMHFANAPDVPGCNHDNPAAVMSCLLDNYPRWFQEQYLQAYAEAGYTHLQRSIGHALYYGNSLESYNALSRLARETYGLFCDHWILGGEALNTPNQDIGYWQPILEPILNSIITSGTMDTCCVGWQLDQWNIPGNVLIAIIAYVALKVPKSIPVYTHWMNEALAWWKTGGEVWVDPFTGATNVMDRFTWWWVMQPYLTGGHHQGANIVAITDPKLYQDKLCDTLDYFGGDTGKGNMGQSQRNGRRNFILTAYEVTAQFQFDGLCSESQGDECGYEAMCTRSKTGYPMGGYGNGGRWPDGTHL